MKQHEKDCLELERLLNYIEIEGDVGDKIVVQGVALGIESRMEKTKTFDKLLKNARQALRHLRGSEREAE